MKNIKKFDDFVNESYSKDEQLNEALNKDIKSFGQDLDNRLKKAGFQTKILIGQSNDEFRKTVRNKTGLALIEVSETPDLQMMFVYVNPSEFEKAKKIVDIFQFIPYNGQQIQKGWTSKQVKGALNPGDIYKQEYKNDGRFDFVRLAKVDTKIVTDSSKTTQPVKNQ